jgi:hypothetical protein
MPSPVLRRGNYWPFLKLDLQNKLSHRFSRVLCRLPSAEHVEVCRKVDPCGASSESARDRISGLPFEFTPSISDTSSEGIKRVCVSNKEIVKIGRKETMDRPGNYDNVD